MELRIKWNRKAIEQLVEAIAYIENTSPYNAERVRTDILKKIDSLLQQPEKYSPDKYKLKNDGSFRSFELHHYRISYRYNQAEIRVIRIRHTKMNPLKY